MSNYPAYSYQPQQMMNTYQQGNYGQPVPMQNLYMDRMTQMQQYQQAAPGLLPQGQGTPQAQGLIGKVVGDVSMVSPNDVPMDGNVAIFPKNDMTEIYCKQWKQDGTIQTVVYRPISEQDPAEGTNIPQVDFNALNDDVRALREDILARLDAIEKSVIKPNARGKKAEVIADE